MHRGRARNWLRRPARRRTGILRMRKVVVINGARCLACKQCMIECAMAHSEASTLAEAMSSDAPPQPRVHIDPVGQFGMPLQCRHCDDAPCVAICPTGAIRRVSDGGSVLLDQESCIGCKFCVAVCPFGAIELSRDGAAMIKCDMCIERTEAGAPPACVAACPTGALQFREVDEWLGERRRRVAQQVLAASGRANKVGSNTQDRPETG